MNQICSFCFISKFIYKSSNPKELYNNNIVKLEELKDKIHEQTKLKRDIELLRMENARLKSIYINLCNDEDLQIRGSIIASFYEVSKIKFEC